ncbi:UNKNOWN [Stylonychia lemnae]|uniref:RPAP1 N-terminal domain-containing protein n=1 Tax=Stylonychia lemnae TaxID=5949 RepID=A0A077ZUW1_STYLE|nr:UNKNOWN [Stylonychia lemnae]|eukprot:CDW73690.1 UNKNOWN [Stylonychia lemnae]
MEGHPIKKLRNRGLIDLDEETASFEKSCVKIVNKREEKKNEQAVNNSPHELSQQSVASMQIISPIRERDAQQLTENQPGQESKNNKSEPTDLQPKKKQSLFAQRLQAKKQEQQTDDTKTEQPQSFPQMFKVDLNSPQSQMKTNKNPLKQLSEFKQIEGIDANMHQENLQKLSQMSKEEIKEQLEFLKSNFNPKLLDKLKNLGSQKKPANSTQEESEDNEEVKRNENSNKPLSKLKNNQKRDDQPIQMSEVHDTISQAHDSMNFTQSYLLNFMFNAQGRVVMKDDQNLSEAENAMVQERNINYIDSEEFENMDQKFFTLKELQNLLGSSDLYQRNYALRLLKSLVKSENISTNDLFKLILNREHTKIIDRLLILLAQNQRIDAIMHLFEVLECIIHRLFGNILTQQENYEILNLAELWKSNLTVNNLALVQFIDSTQLSSSNNGLILNDFKIMSALTNDTVIEQIIKKQLILAERLISDNEVHQLVDQLGLRLNLLNLLAQYSQEVAKIIYEKFVNKLLLKLIGTIMKYCDDWCLPLKNEFMLKQTLKDFITMVTLRDIKVEKLGISREYFRLLSIILNFDQGDIEINEYSLIFQNAFEHSQDPILIAIMIGSLNFKVAQSKVKDQLILPVITLLKQREDFIKNEAIQNISQDYKIKLMTLNSDIGQLEYATDLLKNQLSTLKDLNQVQYQVQQASMNGLKHYFLSLIENKKLKKAQVISILPYLLQIVSKDDQYFLMLLLSSYLFSEQFTNGKLLGNDQVLMQQMYLSYCISDYQTYKVSQPNYMLLKPGDFIILKSLMQEPDMKNELIIPLLDDWFIKPLFYVTNRDDQNLQGLCQSIFRFVDYVNQQYGVNYARDLFRLTNDEYVLLITRLLIHKELNFNRYSKESMFFFIQKNYYKPTQSLQVFSVERFDIQSENSQLIQTYKDAFMKDSFLNILSDFFREQPIDENPIFLFILILALQIHNDLQFRKTLLSDIADVYCCLMVAEEEHLRIRLDIASVRKYYRSSKRDPEEEMFYIGFFEKIMKQIKNYPEDQQATLVDSVLFNLIKINF